MKKLAILSAVAALAAFGWANVANAFDFDAPSEVAPFNSSCMIDGDEVDFWWEDVGADDDTYALGLACGDPFKGRMHATKVEVVADCDGTDCHASVLLEEINGSASLKTDDVCIGSVKGLHTDGTRNNADKWKEDCIGDLD